MFLVSSVLAKSKSPIQIVTNFFVTICTREIKIPNTNQNTTISSVICTRKIRIPNTNKNTTISSVICTRKIKIPNTNVYFFLFLFVPEEPN